MSRRSRTWCLPAAVLGLLLALALALALAGPQRISAAAAAPQAPAPAAPAQGLAPVGALSAPAVAAPPRGLAAGPQEPAAAGRGDGREGPACAPDGPGSGGVPGVPGRFGGEIGAVPVGGVVAEGACPYRPIPAGVLVRGTDRAAPGPLELAVMRV